MAKSPWLPKDDAGKSVWLTRFASQLPTVQPGLAGITPADVTVVQADTAFFNYTLRAQAAVAAYAQQWTAYKNATRNGSDATLGVAPVPPVLGVAPATVAPNIFARTSALVARIKVAPGYTESIGQALQIIGAEQTVGLATLKPLISAILAAGGVTIAWTKQGMDGLEILVDRGDGKGFVFLAIDTVPDYTDTQTPPTGQTALWKYKAIYRQGDDRVGQWSDVVSIAVAG